MPAFSPHSRQRSDENLSVGVQYILGFALIITFGVVVWMTLGPT